MICATLINTETLTQRQTTFDRLYFKPDIAVRRPNRNYHTATGNHMPYEITQCYLPPGRGDCPAFTPAEAGTRFSDPGGMQG